MCDVFDRAVGQAKGMVERGELPEGVRLSTLYVVETREGKLVVGTIYEMYWEMHREGLRWAYVTPELEDAYPELFV